MKLMHLLPYGLSVSATVSLAACSGPQPPIGVPGAMPQTSAITRYKSFYSFGAGYDGQQPKAGERGVVPPDNRQVKEL